MMKTEELILTNEWDKVFPKSEKVDHEKVAFANRFGITLAADLYKPKGVEGKLAAIAVSGPFGAVKEQSSGLYAQTMAERGYLTIAFDPSYTGESGGCPRRVSSPDINTEDFSAAVDYLSCRDDVDPECIGIIGICGWGGISVNAAPDAPQFLKDYVDYYMRPRGFHARSGNSTDGWNMTSSISWLNTNLLQFAHEIESAVMVLHGEKAHSRYMGEMIYEKLTGGKTVVPFATSGGSGIGDSDANMAALAPGATVARGDRHASSASGTDLKSWAGAWL